MHQADAQVGQRLGQHGVGLGRGLQLQRFRLLDQRTDPVHLASFERGGVHALDHFVAPVLVDRAREIGVRPGGSSSITETSRSA